MNDDKIDLEKMLDADTVRFIRVIYLLSFSVLLKIKNSDIRTKNSQSATREDKETKRG